MSPTETYNATTAQEETVLDVKKFLCYYVYQDIESGKDIENVDMKALIKLLQHVCDRMAITTEAMS
jgi:dTDP-D-glucose 4,6-dehydratase